MLPHLFLQMNWRDTCSTTRVKLSAFLIATLALAMGLSTSCKSFAKRQSSESKSAQLYAVVSDSAPFYRYGPQQGNGPDSHLPKDTLVKLIRPSFGFSKVQVLDGKNQGFIASDDIRLAPPALVAAALATPPPVASVSPPRGERFDLNSSDPRLQPVSDTLPAPDLPAADVGPAPDAAPANSPPSP